VCVPAAAFCELDGLCVYQLLHFVSFMVCVLTSCCILWAWWSVCIPAAVFCELDGLCAYQLLYFVSLMVCVLTGCCRGTAQLRNRLIWHGVLNYKLSGEFAFHLYDLWYSEDFTWNLELACLICQKQFIVEKSTIWWVILLQEQLMTVIYEELIFKIMFIHF